MSSVWVFLVLHFWAANPSRYFLYLYTSLFYSISLLSFSFFCVLFRCVSHPLFLPLSSCVGCIPPLIGLALLRSLLRSFLCGCLLFVSSGRDFVCVFCVLLIATMSFAGYFLVRSLLSDSSAYLRTYPRFDLVWFRLSCDHGWIRSGSVDVRKTTTTTVY